MFTDANTHLNREALRGDSARLSPTLKWDAWQAKNVSPCKAKTMLPRGEGLYWKYESTLKALDARLYSAVGAAGELFAVRRELFEK